jgi:hypothetical protein
MSPVPSDLLIAAISRSASVSREPPGGPRADGVDGGHAGKIDARESAVHFAQPPVDDADRGHRKRAGQRDGAGIAPIRLGREVGPFPHQERVMGEKSCGGKCIGRDKR